MNAPACSSYDDSLAFVRRYPRSLAKLAREYGGELDDLKQDLHIFYPIWMRQYDERKGAISTHIFSKLKWRLRSRRRAELRGVVADAEFCEDKNEVGEEDERDLSDDLRSRPLPVMNKYVFDTLSASRDCTCTADLAMVLGITERGARKRLARAMELARAALAAHGQQGDLFGEAA